MRGINPLKIPLLAQKDVDFLRKEAAVVIEIDEEGSLISLYTSRNHRIDVLAVIGPVKEFAVSDPEIIKRKFLEGVLLEIGIGRDKPYHKSQNRERRNEEPKIFLARRRWFRLSRQQFVQIAPIIMANLQERVDKRVETWKCGRDNPYMVKSSRNWWSHRRKKLSVGEKIYIAERGLRFSLNLKDDLFAKYVFWLELNNDFLKKQLVGFARMIDKMFMRYRRAGEYGYFYRKNFSQLKRPLEVKDMVSRKRWPLYYYEEMLEKYLPHGKKNQLIDEIYELLGVEAGETSVERTMAVEAIIPSIKYADCHLKVVRREYNGKNFIVFEIFPSIPPDNSQKVLGDMGESEKD